MGVLGIALNQLEWIIAAITILAAVKSAANGFLHKLWTVINQANEELHKLDEIKEKTEGNKEEIKRTRQDIEGVKQDVQTISGAVQAQILFQNGDLDHDQLIQDLDPDEGQVSRYVDQQSSDDD